MSLQTFRAYLSSAEEECSHSGIFEYGYGMDITLEMADELVLWLVKQKPTQVYLEGCRVDDDILEVLFESFFRHDKSVQLLSLRNNEITDSGTVTIINTLQANKTLKCLDLLRNRINDAGEVAEFLQTSKTSLLSVCGLWSHYRELLVRNPNLQKGDIDLIVADVRKSSDLAFLEMRGSNNNLDRIFTALEDNTSVESLKIVDFTMNAEFASALGNCLSKNTHMKTLSLVRLPSKKYTNKNENKFLSAAAKAMIRLLKGLEKNASITCFRLENFCLSNEVCQALSNMLEANEALIHISLYNCDLFTPGLSIMSKGIQDNNTLRMIKITGTSEIESGDFQVFERGNNYPCTFALSIRLNESDYFFGPGKIIQEYEVDDVVEARLDSGVSLSQFDECRIMGVGRGSTYHVLFPDGEEIEKMSGKDIRKGSKFSRIKTLISSDVFSDEVSNIDSSDNGKYTGPDNENSHVTSYQKGQCVEMRYYDDSIWHAAYVTGIHKENSNLNSLELEDDGTMEAEVESAKINNSKTARLTSSKHKIAKLMMDRGNSEDLENMRSILPISETHEGVIYDQKESTGFYCREILSDTNRPGEYNRSFQTKSPEKPVDPKPFISNSCSDKKFMEDVGDDDNCNRQYRSDPRGEAHDQSKSKIKSSVTTKNVYTVGERCEARRRGGFKWLSGQVTHVHRNGNCDIMYDNGNKEVDVEVMLIRKKNTNHKYMEKAKSIIQCKNERGGFMKHGQRDESKNEKARDDEKKCREDKISKAIVVKGINPSERKGKGVRSTSMNASDLGLGDYVEVASTLFEKTKLGYINKISKDGMFVVRYSEDEYELGVPKDRIRLMPYTEKGYNAKPHTIRGESFLAPSYAYYSTQIDETGRRSSCRYLPITSTSIRSNGAGNGYGIEHEDGTQESRVSSSYVGASKDLPHVKYVPFEESHHSKKRTFSLRHYAYASTNDWLPMLATIPSAGTLAVSTEIIVMPSSEHCEFYGEPHTPCWRLYVNNSAFNQSPLFVRAKSDAPEICTGKICFYSNSIVISSISFKMKKSTSPGEKLNEINYLTGEVAQLFKSVFIVCDEEERLKGTEFSSPMLNDVFEDAIRTLSSFLSITRPEKDRKLCTMLLSSSDHIQVISTAQTLSASLSSDSVSEVARVMNILSTSIGEANIKNISLTSAADIAKADSKEVKAVMSRLPLHSIVTNPHLQSVSFLNKVVGKEAELQRSMLFMFNAISEKLFHSRSETHASPPIPMGMMFFPGSFVNEKPDLRYIIESETHLGDMININVWYLCFFSENIHNKVSTCNSPSFKCVEVSSEDIEFLHNILPFLKATIAILMSLMLSTPSGGKFSPLIAPFNGYFVAQRLNVGTLLELNKLYEEKLSARVKLDSTLSPHGPNSNRPNGALRRPSSKLSPTINDIQEERKIDSSLIVCVKFMESAYAGLFTIGMKRQLALASTRLNFLSPYWKKTCDMVQASVGCKNWWICGGEAKEMWNKLSVFADGRTSFNVLANYPDVAPSPQPASAKLSHVARKAEEEIFTKLMREIGLVDALVASICANILAIEGCENWDDVLKLPEYLSGDNSNIDCVRLFFHENRIPAVAAGKITKYIQCRMGTDAKKCKYCL